MDCTTVGSEGVPRGRRSCRQKGSEHFRGNRGGFSSAMDLTSPLVTRRGVFELVPEGEEKKRRLPWHGG